MQNIFLQFQLEESGAGDMDTTSSISENELGKNLNGSTLSTSTAAADSSPSAEEELRWTTDQIMTSLASSSILRFNRLSASSSSESVATPSAASKMKEEPDTLVSRHLLCPYPG